MKPIVAIVGRPNVGKSTLFNRITRSRDAIVDDMPGVTRDRHYGDAAWDGVEFTLVDTGGFVSGDQDYFAPEIRFQILQAIEDADVVILLLDGKGGISPFDEDIVKILREVEKPVFYAVNKIDGLEQEVKLYEYYSLGLDKLYPLSAEHRYGVPDFLDDLVGALPPTDAAESGDMIKLAVVGKPNVGKSSLINRILGHKRLVVSEIPGTTRDAIDSVVKIHGKSYLLIDTAGIRRKKKVSKKIEKFSIIKALKSLERCDVALIVIDAFEGVTEQDVNIAGYAYERGCGCILLLNKWDIVEKDSKTEKKYRLQLRMDAKFINFAPAMTISALTGQRVAKIFKIVDEVYSQYTRRIGTGQINRIMERAMERNEPSLYRGRRLKIYYFAQVSTRPPTFVIRAGTGLDQTPLRIIFRKRTGRGK